MHVVAFEQRHVPLVGDLDGFHVRRAARAMAATVAAERMSELAPWMTSIGTRDKRVEFVPQRRQRALDVDAGERAGQAAHRRSAQARRRFICQVRCAAASH